MKINFDITVCVFNAQRIMTVYVNGEPQGSLTSSV